MPENRKEIRLTCCTKHSSSLRGLLLVDALAVRLGGVVALVDDKVLGPVVLAAREVLVENSLGAVGVSLR
jgi:hypothetical protein